jgi:6-phosphofructokinase 2
MAVKIVTITMSPCIDKSTTVDKFIPEKKLKCSYPLLEAGGGGINVSRALKNFNTDSLCLYISGGYTGNILNNLVFHEKLNAIPIPSKVFTRENFIVFENQTHLQFRFGMPVNKVADVEWRSLMAELKKTKPEYVILSGSISSDINAKFFEQLQAHVKKTKAKFLIDTAGEPLKKLLKEGAFLIKPNQNEFSGLFGSKVLNANQIVSKAKQIIKKGKIENILVTLGKDGAVLIAKTGAWHFLAPKLKVKSTVGAGDSMVAGIVYMLHKKHSIEEAVKFGIACGSATTINSGMQLCTLSGAKSLLNKVKINKL